MNWAVAVTALVLACAYFVGNRLAYRPVNALT
jgi:hypothetical protein